MPPRIHTFVKRSPMPVAAEELFRWHEASGAFEKLTPPWERVEILERSGGIRDGARVVLRVGPWPLRLQWELTHCEYIAGRQFCDVQVHGPFAHYKHFHLMHPDGPQASILEDRIEFALPFGALGALLGTSFVLAKFEKLFAFRHRVTREALSASAPRNQLG